jgi:hypothetical protein
VNHRPHEAQHSHKPCRTTIITKANLGGFYAREFAKFSHHPLVEVRCDVAQPKRCTEDYTI